MRTFGEAPPPPTLFERFKSGLARSTGALGQNLSGIFSKKILDAETVAELEEALVRADLGAGLAAKLADRVIVTSDNPRNEAPDAIVADLLAGMPAGQAVELDRAVAIRAAVVGAGPDDLVLLAGKGHEDHQDIRGKRRPFSDARVAEKVLKEWGHAPA